MYVTPFFTFWVYVGIMNISALTKISTLKFFGTTFGMVINKPVSTSTSHWNNYKKEMNAKANKILENHTQK